MKIKIITSSVVIFFLATNLLIAQEPIDMKVYKSSPCDGGALWSGWQNIAQPWLGFDFSVPWERADVLVSNLPYGGSYERHFEYPRESPCQQWEEALPTGHYMWVVRFNYFEPHVGNFRWSEEYFGAEFYVDRTPPSVPNVIESHSGATPIPTNIWTTHNTPYFTIESTSDVGSGVTYCQRSLNGGAFIITSYGYQPTLADGSYKYSYRAVDYVGLVSQTRDFYLNIDANPPSPPNIAATYCSASATSWPAWKSLPRPIFHIDAGSDGAGSGVLYTHCSINGGAYATVPSIWIATYPSGSYTFDFRSIDRVGFFSSIKRIYVRIDVDLPTLEIASPSNNSLVNVNSLSVNWTASDEHSGIKNYEYSLDMGEWVNNSTLTSLNLEDLSDGSHNLDIRAVDNALNAEVQSLDFIVDTNPPEITSEHPDISLDANDNCEATIGDYTSTLDAIDAVDTLLEITQTPESGTIISGAENLITLRATDDADNYAEVSFNVELVDVSNPQITSIHDAQNLNADENCEAVLPDYTSGMTATDNCDTELSFTQSPEAGIFISGADNTVILRARDDAGNYSETSFVVNVLDVTSPIITSVHENKSLNADDNCEAILPDYTSDLIYSDNCDSTFIIAQSPEAGTLISGTENQISMTVTDDDGNYAEVRFNVEVVDGQNPVITSVHESQSLDADQNCEAVLPDYTTEMTAVDNCDSELNFSQSPVAGTILSGNENIISLRATDEAGNYSELNFSILLIDNTSPEIECLESQTIDLGSSGTEYTVNGTEFDPLSASDNCSNFIVENDFTNTASLAGAILPVGTTDIVWTIIDEAGNEKNCTLDITVNSTVNISDLKSLGVSVYPNPTSGILHFKSQEIEISSLQISNVLGQKVLEKRFLGSDFDLDITSFKSGMYFARILIEEKLYVVKIIKE